MGNREAGGAERGFCGLENPSMFSHWVPSRGSGSMVTLGSLGCPQKKPLHSASLPLVYFRRGVNSPRLPTAVAMR